MKRNANEKYSGRQQGDAADDGRAAAAAAALAAEALEAEAAAELEVEAATALVAASRVKNADVAAGGWWWKPPPLLCRLVRAQVFSQPYALISQMARGRAEGKKAVFCV